MEDLVDEFGGKVLHSVRLVLRQGLGGTVVTLGPLLVIEGGLQPAMSEIGEVLGVAVTEELP
jgi:hypothetical protein